MIDLTDRPRHRAVSPVVLAQADVLLAQVNLERALVVARASRRRLAAVAKAA